MLPGLLFGPREVDCSSVCVSAVDDSAGSLLDIQGGRKLLHLLTMALSYAEIYYYFLMVSRENLNKVILLTAKDDLLTLYSLLPHPQLTVHLQPEENK